MQDLPADWGALCALVLLLGLRHGLDADHLAAIDGLTRVNSRAGRRHARYCGALFSLGHGAIVLAIATLAGLAGARWAPPEWFEPLGSAISIGFLATLGIVNLRAVWRTPSHEPVALVGVKGRLVQQLLGRFGSTGSAWAVFAVGALFALSFDTLSQSALFAVLAVRFGGLEHALMLGALFVLGMLASDGVNGWWISHLILRTDRQALLASRVMTVAVAGVSLLVAALGAAKLLAEPVAALTDGRELWLGAAVIGLIALSYGVAMALSRRSARLQSADTSAGPGARQIR
jgi:high-affinity nickel-transport protein